MEPAMNDNAEMSNRRARQQKRTLTDARREQNRERDRKSSVCRARLLSGQCRAGQSYPSALFNTMKPILGLKLPSRTPLQGLLS
ncbi:hypothetical protein DH86_00000406 [Scytalidium sp. 3C]|nr:hypothetical protein DH86_00000406 [Scytalidium sp. 3C]